jgi:glutathione S-transferase
MYWFHYANGSFQPAFSLSMIVNLIPGLPEDSMVKHLSQNRLNAALKLMNDRLANNKWLAGDQFTIADIMSVYSATTQRYWGPAVSYKEYPHITRWLKDCAARPGYQRAREKGDPEMKDLIDEDAPEPSLLVSDGVNAGHWRK